MLHLHNCSGRMAPDGGSKFLWIHIIEQVSEKHRILHIILTWSYIWVKVQDKKNQRHHFIINYIICINDMTPQHCYMYNWPTYCRTYCTPPSLLPCSKSRSTRPLCHDIVVKYHDLSLFAEMKVMSFSGPNIVQSHHSGEYTDIHKQSTWDKIK